MPSPATGVLSPFSEEIIEISGYSDIWGVYSDNLICQVSSYIPLYFMFVRSTFNQLSATDSCILRYNRHLKYSFYRYMYSAILHICLYAACKDQQVKVQSVPVCLTLLKEY